VVKLRFYGGLSVEEAASALGISRANAYRHWSYARAVPSSFPSSVDERVSFPRGLTDRKCTLVPEGQLTNGLRSVLP
jgi:hypothetical protein